MTDNQSFIDPLRLGVTTDDDPDAVLHLDQTWRVPDAGAAGITALTVTERAGASTNVTAGNQGSATATCNAGEISIGGGGEVTSALGNMMMSGSRRSGTTGWTMTYRNDSGAVRTFTPYVICLDIT